MVHDVPYPSVMMGYNLASVIAHSLLQSFQINILVQLYE